jgi:succinate dehydrogenase / fumarate reductase iron-sulfur subunit
MANPVPKTKIIKVFRYDPAVGGPGHFDRFELKTDDESLTTILDVLIRLQKTQDPSLAIRYACRVSMCGSCGMVINGREGLACKTVLADLKGEEVTLRPLNHFPVVKDLVVDMEPLFRKFEEGLTYFHAAQEQSEPSIIRPDSRERQVIESSTECIACGCCVSACTMANGHKEDYLGPAVLNRVFTLLADSRDGLHEERLARSLGSCYHCRTELNCTEVCPKEISSTRAIKYIQMLAAKEALKPGSTVRSDQGDTLRQGVPKLMPPRSAESAVLTPEPEGLFPAVPPPALASRREFFSRTVLGIAALTIAFLGSVLAATALAPTLRKRPEQWVDVGKAEDFPAGSVKTAQIRYPVKDGFYESTVSKPVFVSHQANSDQFTVFNSRCTHLGCTLRWDDGKNLFLCDCHGGQFKADGVVKAGPPPRPMDRYLTMVKDGHLFVKEA